MAMRSPQSGCMDPHGASIVSRLIQKLLTRNQCMKTSNHRLAVFPG